MAVVFYCVSAILLIFHLMSRGKYDGCIAQINRQEYSLRSFLPIGLKILAVFRYKYCTGYDMSLLTLLSEIKGHKYSRVYLQVHWANKIVLILLCLQLLSFIGIWTGPATELLFLTFFTPAATFTLTDYDLKKKVKKRHLDLQNDFPDFISKLTLLINAGMTVAGAWEKIVQDNNKDSPLYVELGMTLMDIRTGKSECQAYQDFAKRCRVMEITKFISVIIQNLKKGNSEMVPALQFLSRDCWEMRKNTARRFGEEASTRLILPITIMLVAILIIVSVPAIMAIQRV